MITPSELLDELGRLRVKTGLWLFPPFYLGREVDEARRLCLEPIDLRGRLLAILPEGTRYSGLSDDRILQLVDMISNETGDWAGALIYHFDLLISRLNSEDRGAVWDDLLISLPHRERSVVIAMPATATHLLPPAHKLAIWRQEKRLVEPTER